VTFFPLLRQDAGNSGNHTAKKGETGKSRSQGPLILQTCDLPLQKRFDILEMAFPVQGAVHTELGESGLCMGFDLGDPFGAELVELTIDLLYGGDSKLGGRVRVERVTDFPQRVVDRTRIDRRLIQSLLLPALENDTHTVIPEGQVSEQSGDSPAVVGGAGQVFVGEAAHEGFQPETGILVLAGIGESHVCLSGLPIL
jgi:hypothetical protein